MASLPTEAPPMSLSDGSDIHNGDEAGNDEGDDNSIPSEDQVQRWQVGAIVEVDDRLASHAWCRARILKIRGTRALVHFCGWSDRWDTWTELSEIRELGTMTTDSTSPKDRSKFRFSHSRLHAKFDSVNHELQTLVKFYERYTEKAKRSWNIGLGVFLCDDWSVDRIVSLTKQLRRLTNLLVESMFEDGDEKERVLTYFRDCLSLTAFVLHTREVSVISLGEPLPNDALQNLLQITADLLTGNDTVFFRKHGHFVEDYQVPENSYHSHMRDSSESISSHSVHALELINHFGFCGGLDLLLSSVQSCTVYNSTIAKMTSILASIAHPHYLDAKYIENISCVFRRKLEAWNSCALHGVTIDVVEVFCNFFTLANYALLRTSTRKEPLVGVAELWGLCLRCRIRGHSKLVSLFQSVHFKADPAGARSFHEMWQRFFAQCVDKARQCSSEDRMSGERVKAYRRYRAEFLRASEPADLDPEEQSESAESLASISPLSSTNDMWVYSSSLRHRFTLETNITDPSSTVPELSRIWEMLELFLHFSGEALNLYYKDLFHSVVVCEERSINASYVSLIWRVLTSVLPSTSYLNALNRAYNAIDGADNSSSHFDISHKDASHENYVSSLRHEGSSSPNSLPEAGSVSPASPLPMESNSTIPLSQSESFHVSEHKSVLYDHTGLYSVSPSCSGLSTPDLPDTLPHTPPRRSSLSVDSLELKTAFQVAAKPGTTDTQDLETTSLSRGDSNENSSSHNERYSLGHTESASSASSPRQAEHARNPPSLLNTESSCPSSMKPPHDPRNSPISNTTSSIHSPCEKLRVESDDESADGSTSSLRRTVEASSSSSLRHGAESNDVTAPTTGGSCATPDSKSSECKQNSPPPAHRSSFSISSLSCSSFSSSSSRSSSSISSIEKSFLNSSQKNVSAVRSPPCDATHPSRGNSDCAHIATPSNSTNTRRPSNDNNSTTPSLAPLGTAYNHDQLTGAAQAPSCPSPLSKFDLGCSSESLDHPSFTHNSVATTPLDSPSASSRSPSLDLQNVSKEPSSSKFFTLVPDDLTDLIVQFVCSRDETAPNPFAPTVPLNTRVSGNID